MTNDKRCRRPAGATAGAVFAAGLGAFTVYWLGAWPLWAFGIGVAFSSVVVLSCFGAYVAGHKRVIGRFRI